MNSIFLLKVHSVFLHVYIRSFRAKQFSLFKQPSNICTYTHVYVHTCVCIYMYIYVLLEITRSLQPYMKHYKKKEAEEETLLAAISWEYLAGNERNIYIWRSINVRSNLSSYLSENPIWKKFLFTRQRASFPINRDFSVRFSTQEAIKMKKS